MSELDQQPPADGTEAPNRALRDDLVPLTTLSVAETDVIPLLDELLLERLKITCMECGEEQFYCNRTRDWLLAYRDNPQMTHLGTPCRRKDCRGITRSWDPTLLLATLKAGYPAYLRGVAPTSIRDMFRDSHHGTLPASDEASEEQLLVLQSAVLNNLESSAALDEAISYMLTDQATAIEIDCSGCDKSYDSTFVNARLVTYSDHPQHTHFEARCPRTHKDGRGRIIVSFRPDDIMLAWRVLGYRIEVGTAEEHAEDLELFEELSGPDPGVTGASQLQLRIHEQGHFGVTSS